MSDRYENSNENHTEYSGAKNSLHQSVDENLNDLNGEKLENKNLTISTVSAETSLQTNTPLNDDSSNTTKIAIQLNDNNDSELNEEVIRPEKVCLPELKHDSNHIILFELPLIPNEVPKTSTQLLVRDNEPQVRLPFNETIKFVHIINGERKLKNHGKSYWEFIEDKLIGLSENLDSVKDLEKAIKSYNFSLRNSNFDVLHKLSSDDKKILSKIVKLALQLPTTIPHSIPLLCQKENKTIFLSQHQISCLLANAFLCTFPQHKPSYPSINFHNLFQKSGYKNDSSVKHEKLKCIINYFKRVLSQPPKGVVSFERRFLESNETPKWNKSMKKLSKFKILEKGTIESEGKDMVQVDFANKLVGGGVLNRGCVQEEIRFCINPELIISRLFTQQLLDEEVLIIKGSEQFSTYDGYGNSFEWDEDFKDLSATDDWGRKSTTIIAMDAIRFEPNNYFIQYDLRNLNRELNKAYCGFMDRSGGHKAAIATGNWGCGAFNGDKILKALIQLMAASECERDLNYFTFNDSSLKKELDKFYLFICEHNFQVRHLYKALQLYDAKVIKNSKSYKKDLIEFISKSLESIFI